VLPEWLAANAPAALADEGIATWYGQPYQGRRMANGQVYDMNDPTTTASNRFPLGTWVRVTNPANGHSIEDNLGGVTMTWLTKKERVYRLLTNCAIKIVTAAVPTVPVLAGSRSERGARR